MRKEEAKLTNYKEFKYNYIIDDTFDIDTSFTTDMSQIKNQILEQTDSKIIRTSEYPKGFKIMFIQEAEQIEIRTNLPLYFQDGKYHVKFD